VKSAANCGACHGGADTGDYGDHRLLIPEGLSLAQRRAWRD
ncbi:MAG: cytochrome C, partial [Rubrivivax sp.]|nr:cytochrome C [Rubrivivax sp.]